MEQKNTSYINSPPFQVAREGYPLIIALAFVTLIMALLGLTGITFLCLAAIFSVIFFFRDPARIAPQDPGTVLSPADGRVIYTGVVDKTPFDNRQMFKISIFMSVFNVHVNRIPFEGRVTKVLYNPGKFFSANLDKASKENEHNAVEITTATGNRLWVVQIAGLIARRIVCKIAKGDQVHKGRRFGMICFGSRLDVYLPADVKVTVYNGEKTLAGETILGYMP